MADALGPGRRPPPVRAAVGTTPAAARDPALASGAGPRTADRLAYSRGKHRAHGGRWRPAGANVRSSIYTSRPATRCRAGRAGGSVRPPRRPRAATGTRSGSVCRCRTAKLRAKRRAVRAVLRAGHMTHVCLPTARMTTALQSHATASSHSWWVLIAVEAIERRGVAQQSLAPLVGTATIQNQSTRPAATQHRASEVPPDVRVLGGAENEVLHAIGALALSHRVVGRGGDRHGWPDHDREQRQRGDPQPEHVARA